MQSGVLIFHLRPCEIVLASKVIDVSWPICKTSACNLNFFQCRIYLMPAKEYFLTYPILALPFDTATISFVLSVSHVIFHDKINN